MNMEDEIKFFEGCKYRDQYDQIWIAKMYGNKKALWRDESGLGLWNFGKNLTFNRLTPTIPEDKK